MRSGAGSQLLLAGVLLGAGVQAGEPPIAPHQDAGGTRHTLRSVLVLPPFNKSQHVEATYSCLSTVTQPLAERGYYVFPVAVIDQYMKANGMPTATEMQQVSLAKVVEIIGADAVLYLDVEQFNDQGVGLRARLVDSRSAAELWAATASAVKQAYYPEDEQLPHNVWDFLGQMVVEAVVETVVDRATDDSHQLCAQASAQLFSAGNNKLPYGPYHPKHGAL
jgi:hypothetical protein